MNSITCDSFFLKPRHPLLIQNKSEEVKYVSEGVMMAVVEPQKEFPSKFWAITE